MSIKKHIPNTITLLNMLCGVIGIIAVFNDKPQTAFILMLAAACFDFCDGLAARLLGAYSEIGKERAVGDEILASDRVESLDDALQIAGTVIDHCYHSF